ncbi:MAG: hypothetical protein GX963_03680 [Bacteroidales bacterium]|jgi:hypothetical protein|nr:hypothetical protein [Bacteroidales bacterium]
MAEDRQFIEFPINIKLRHSDRTIILKKAITEGSLHWMFDAIQGDGVLIIHGLDGSVYMLTEDNFIHGLQQAIHYIPNPIIDGFVNIDSIDSDTADMILQLALFNDLPFD